MFLEAQLNAFFLGKVGSVGRFGQKHGGRSMAFDSWWSIRYLMGVPELGIKELSD